MSSSQSLYVRLRQSGPIPLAAEFECEAGKVLTLVGPSGSGKSTILRCIAGLYQPREGKIRCGNGQAWLDTENRISVPPQQRRVGMLFQDYALFPHLTALDNVKLALDPGPPEQRTARARELLAQVRLEGLETRYPASLSGGQQQRVGLARALARDPKVLLLDEPFSAVDQVTRRKLRFEMAEFTRELGMPIVLVTHDLDEAQMLADSLAVLHKGTTLQSGAPHQVLQRPLNATVARLMDMRNVFAARVIDQQPGAETTRIRWRDLELDVTYHDSFKVGDKLCWCIPAADVLLHRRVQPSRGVRENPVHGRVSELITISGITNVIVLVGEDCRLHMDLPPHVIRRNHVAIGEDIGMSLLKQAIHLMPWDPDWT